MNSGKVATPRRRCHIEHVLEIDEDRHWVSIHFIGPVTMHDLATVPGLLAGADGWSPDMPRLLIWDRAVLSTVNPVDAGTFLLPQLQSELRDLPAGADLLIAHVCSDPLKRAVVKFWLALLEAEPRIHARLFRDQIQAVDWLSQRQGRRQVSA